MRSSVEQHEASAGFWEYRGHPGISPDEGGVTEMPISRKEEWVPIAELDDQDQIRFTPEFQTLMGELGWEAKSFVGHLLGLWYDPFEHLLDYTSGEATCSQDQPGRFDRNGL